MFFWLRGVASSLGLSLAAYVLGIVLAVSVTVLGSHRLVTGVLAELAAPEGAAQVPKPAANRAPLPRIEVRAGYMTPLHGPMPKLSKSAARLPVLAQPIFFGSSSRNWVPANRDEDDDEQRPKASNTYRTVCVRLCDGYYFPISFSVTADRFARDAKTCERSCGGQARLFAYRNPGADIDDMTDMRGQPYRKLNTAFLYRTQYVADCRCQPNPWDAEAREKHRVYALTAAKAKGNKQAAKELNELTAKQKLAAKQPQKGSRPPAAGVDAKQIATTGKAPNPSVFDPAPHSRMSLGRRVSTPRAPLSRRSAVESTQSDWRQRAFWQ